MKLAAFIVLCSTPLPAQDTLPVQLDNVARIASVMVDGDLARRIQTPRSIASMLETNPRDQWAAADNYDVDHQAFTTTKKTLIRLSRLCATPCDVNLWMAVPAKPSRIQIVIRNVHEMSQFWPWGALHQETPAEMKRVLDTGERLSVQHRPGIVSVLAPVRDSLGDIVALVEVVAQAKPDPQENVQ